MNNGFRYRVGGDFISVLAVIAYLFSGRFCEMCIHLTLDPKRDSLNEIQSQLLFFFFFLFSIHRKPMSRVNVLNRSCHS